MVGKPLFLILVGLSQKPDATAFHTYPPPWVLQRAEPGFEQLWPDAWADNFHFWKRWVKENLVGKVLLMAWDKSAQRYKHMRQEFYGFFVRGIDVASEGEAYENAGLAGNYIRSKSALGTGHDFNGMLCVCVCVVCVDNFFLLKNQFFPPEKSRIVTCLKMCGSVVRHRAIAVLQAF